MLRRLMWSAVLCASGCVPSDELVLVEPAHVELETDTHVWRDASPEGLGFTGRGALVVLSDPARPSDFYAFLSYAGVYKSKDFGRTWAKVSVDDEDTLMTCEPGSAVIDPNPARDPRTPPTLYLTATWGTHGLYKSTDGGAHWQQLFDYDDPVFEPLGTTPLPNLRQVVVDPQDANHVLISFREQWPGTPGDAGLAESTDGGASWSLHAPPAGFGHQHTLVFVTSSIWLTSAAWIDNSYGTWRTDSAGRASGVPNPSAWQRVASIEGVRQPYIDRDRDLIYMPGIYGLHRSADRGLTWENIRASSPGWTNVVATADTLYLGAEFGSPWSPALEISARDDGEAWEAEPLPEGMLHGAMWAATSWTGAQWVMVSANNVSGLWRYVEAP